MSEPQAVFLETLKLIFGFITENSIAIVVVILLYLFRDGITGFISRLTSLSYKGGGSEVDLLAASPPDIKPEQKKLGAQEEKPSVEVEEAQAEVVYEKKEHKSLEEMYRALDEGDSAGAEAAFRKYALADEDEIRVDENKAFYLYLKFEKLKDYKAVAELENLARQAKNEESKYNTLMWLAFCFREGMEYRKESELWRLALGDTASESLKTRAVVNLSYSLDREEKAAEAKKLLNDRLRAVVEEKQKSAIYEALSKVEDSLGNKKMATYCKDKSLEFDPLNTEELFRSAYSASEENVDEISISNYVRLLRIDENNSAALNNIGTRAQEAGLNIKAVEAYKKSAKLKHTLSVANQGFLLLEAGFTDEAEKIANDALRQDEPHQNLHKLIAAINERRENQEKAWDELCLSSLNKQKQLRQYTEQYYLGRRDALEGEWFANGVDLVSIKINGGSVSASWTKTLDGLGGSSTWKFSIAGSVSGSTIDGIYTRESVDGRPSSILGLNRSGGEAFVAYLAGGGDEIVFLSKEPKQIISLIMKRERAQVDSK